MRAPLIIFGSRLCIAALVLLLAFVSPATARSDDPLALSKSYAGVEIDTAKSRQVLAKYFSGVWRVVHKDRNGPTRSGRAEVANNGSDISLVLTGPDGPEYYELVEVDAVRFSPDTSPFIGSLTARFKKGAEPVLDRGGAPVATARPFPVPANQTLLSFKKGEFDLDLIVVWPPSEYQRIRISLGADASEDKYEGLWSEEVGDSLKGGGLATWMRGAPRIDGVLVVDNQLDPSAGSNYPYRPDGTKIKQVSNRRTLVVYGQNLPDMADRADIVSLSPSISYAPDFRDGDDRSRVISSVLERAKVANPEKVDAFIVKANLAAGITPGYKAMSVDGAPGQWPLIFANQAARLRFSRSGGVPTEVFYEGDTGFVELSFQTDMPLKNIGLRLLKGDENPTEIGVLLATRVDDEDPLFTTYRSDPIQLYSRENESLSPPEDENAVRVPVLEGMVLQAALLDPAEALTIPPVARADIFSNPSQLGALWKDALDRVAVCNRETIGKYETYQLEEATRVSKVIITKLSSRNIPLLKGDYAAALLIRDEFVKKTLEILPEFEKQAGDVELARAAREVARQRPEIATKPFWRDSKVAFVKKRWYWDKETEYSLAETLNIEKVAKEQGVEPKGAQYWAEKNTVIAAQAYVKKMEDAASRALDAGDCDIGELLLIAGHRSEPVITNIMPRLVKLETNQGPPQRQYWVSDNVAQGFVKSLYIAGAAVRALEEYSEVDSKVAASIAAIATAGLSFGLEVGGYAAAKLWVSLAETAVDLAMGLVGVEQYFASEDFYEFVQGAAPALGEDILNDALAGRQSAVMAAVGVLLPTVSGASNLAQLRSLKNIQRGQKLFQATDGILDDLTKLDDVDRTNLAAYYTDMLRQARKSGVNKLDDADRAALSAFQDYFKGRLPPDTQPITKFTEAMDADPYHPDWKRYVGNEPRAVGADVAKPFPRPGNETVKVNPASANPDEAATQISPNAWEPRPADATGQRPREPRPDEVPDMFEKPPGERLKDKPEGYAEDLIERSRRGETLTEDEVIDKLDSMRVERKKMAAENAAREALEAEKAAPEGSGSESAQ